MELRLYLKYGSKGPTILGCSRRARGTRRIIVRADEKLTAFLELESAIRSATPGKSACYENLPPDRATKPYPSDQDWPVLWQSLFGA
jgi:hypothetical protein